MDGKACSAAICLYGWVEGVVSGPTVAGEMLRKELDCCLVDRRLQLRLAVAQKIQCHTPLGHYLTRKYCGVDRSLSIRLIRLAIKEEAGAEVNAHNYQCDLLNLFKTRAILTYCGFI